MKALITSAGVQDRDGAVAILEGLDEASWPLLEEFVADGGYRGEKVESAAYLQGQWDLRIVTRRDDQKGFAVQPVRWIVERTFAWLSQCRRLGMDLERTIASALGFIHFAMIRLMARRLAKGEQ